ncbi:glycosyltransferase family 2 protein, partial [Bacteroides thetaiotaomicron]|uniref:glycosyltransferase family 2 protein n=1 Tax=Bacteroides thetaiotaomicron TaxID=818 RepID=UPI00374FC1CA|nr:glycosyltransferase family 2 protein [Bacteroides thetaiotaomicron]
PVDWAIGAALFMRIDFYAYLGGFDQNYFLYMEDEDICLRSWKCNRPVIYFPESIMTHNHLRGSSKIGRKALLHLQSMFVFFKKHGCSIGSFCSKMQACSKLEYY